MDEPQSQPKSPTADEELGRVPLNFNIPVGLTSRYAHHMLVQASEFEVTLSFFELKPPVVLGSVDAQREALKGGIVAECVARVTIAKARYKDFIRAFTTVPLDDQEEK